MTAADSGSESGSGVFHDEIVLVTGATGLAGVPLVRYLLERGYRVRAFVRNPAKAARLLGEHPRLEIAAGDMTDRASIARAVAGAGWIAHLAALKCDEAASARVNAGGALALAEEAKRAGVRFIIHVSTQSVRLTRKGIYARTKLAAEQAIFASGVPATTLRPSIVYADTKSGILGTLAAAAARLPIVPVIGAGRAGFHPLRASDLAVMIECAARAEETRGKVYDAGGPDRVSMDSMLDFVLARLGKKRRRVHVPGWLALAIAQALRVLPRPPLTRSNVYGALEDVAMDVEVAYRELGFTPLGFPAGLAGGTADAQPAASPDAPPAAAAAAAAARTGAECEAELLLGYVFATKPKEWRPGTDLVLLYERALRAHGVPPEHRLDPRLYRRRALLGALDALTRLFWPRCTLQKKLIIAAALVECQPASAEWLLPRERSVRGAVAALARTAWRAARKLAAGLPLLLFPGFVRRNAGLA
ncbi:MAG: NAD(P)H-binding protein [Planctomycetes bacterium]|nr:NAD(P)H-binding protein [Planctomycetota bacterium]